jgi:hypothetical protein
VGLTFHSLLWEFVQYLNTCVFFHIIFWILKGLRYENKSCPCYSVMAQSRSLWDALGWGCSSVVKCLHGIPKTLDSISSTTSKSQWDEF